MKPILLLLLTTSLFCAEGVVNPNREQMKNEWQVHHSNVVSERDRHRSEVRAILADDPERLQKFEAHWSKVDAERQAARHAHRERVQERQGNREGRREQRRQNRE